MKIKLYVVTYNRKDDLQKTLESLFSTDIEKFNVDVFIVNNHSNFSLNEELSSKVKVLHNVMRPDFSTGHLSRNYNEILIHGFKDLNAPDCDLVMHSHDDNIFDPLFFEKITELHKKFSFITFSQGCGLCSYTPNAVKAIGMWDERFCTIGYHEGDYFLRAVKYNNAESSINDWDAARRKHNDVPEKLVTKTPGTSQNDSHSRSIKNYSVCRQLFTMKWGISDVSWTGASFPDPMVPTYVLYPYFERNLTNHNQQYFAGIDFNGRPYI